MSAKATRIQVTVFKGCRFSVPLLKRPAAPAQRRDQAGEDPERRIIVAEFRTATSRPINQPLPRRIRASSSGESYEDQRILVRVGSGWR
jgi:hypothetical protein